MKDIIGKALWGYFNGDREPCMVVRGDGLTVQEDVSSYFSEYREWSIYEKKILKYAFGRILDIGAGTGRHALYLQNKGFEVYAIDNSPRAVEIMKQRGVKNVYLMDLRELKKFPGNHFDSILLLCNNFGIAGTPKETKKLLKALAKISSGKARIITTIENPYFFDWDYCKLNREKGIAPGQMKFKRVYKGEAGDYFYLLELSPQELRILIRDTNWNVLKIVKGKGVMYGAVLNKKWLK